VAFSKLPPIVVPVTFVDNWFNKLLPAVPTSISPTDFLVAYIPTGVVNPHFRVLATVGKYGKVNPAIAPPTVPTASAFSTCFASSSFPCSLRSSLA
jgi:hypothetical protein